jgi:DNA repair photolyase
MAMDDETDPQSAAPLRPRKGRGAVSAPVGRFESLAREAADDGWDSLEQDLPPLATSLQVDTARSVIARNDSPDVPFEQSINPYRGCEHGCVYCFARPTHAYYGLSPGLDFETRLFYKPDAPEVLARELRKRGYQCVPIALGVNTDAYQPVERKTGLTRRILEVLRDFRHPLSIVTKSALIERDVDILRELARFELIQVMISITTLDSDLARTLEPRAAAPQRRLRAMETLCQAGIPCGVMFAPIIPALNDHEMETVLKAARQAGAVYGGYVLLRLPREVQGLFTEWLQAHYPDKADHVLSLLRSCHGGKEYDARFGQRMRGSGPYAELLAQRFKLACKRLGLNKLRRDLTCRHFRPPPRAGEQLGLL